MRGNIKPRSQSISGPGGLIHTLYIHSAWPGIYLHHACVQINKQINMIDTRNRGMGKEGGEGEREEGGELTFLPSEHIRASLSF